MAHDLMALDSRQIASREQFDRQSRNYGSSHILADTSDVEAALAADCEGHGRRALDVATGGGHTAVFLAAKGWTVTAADLSSSMLERASELAAGRGLSIATALHEAENLPYPDATFDLVTCRVAAHHFSDPGRFVEETVRVLRHGGRFVLIDGSVPDGEEEAAGWLHSVEKLRDPSHGRFHAPAEWTSLCTKAGLVVESCLLAPFKQPDLEWYFETAATSPANREAVRQLVAGAPASATEAFQLAEEDGKTVWWWPRLTLAATRP